MSIFNESSAPAVDFPQMRNSHEYIFLERTQRLYKTRVTTIFWKKSELVNNTVSILEPRLSSGILIFYNHLCCICICVSACMQGHNICLEVRNSLQGFVLFFNCLGHMDQTWVVRFGRHLFLSVPLCWPADKFSCFK